MTARAWPMRWARSVAWASAAGFHHGSQWITVSAAVRLSRCRPPERDGEGGRCPDKSGPRRRRGRAWRRRGTRRRRPSRRGPAPQPQGSTNCENTSTRRPLARDRLDESRKPARLALLLAGARHRRGAGRTRPGAAAGARSRWSPPREADGGDALLDVAQGGGGRRRTSLRRGHRAELVDLLLGGSSASTSRLVRRRMRDERARGSRSAAGTSGRR